MCAFRLVSLCVLLLASVSPAYADAKTLTADASYIMGDGETPDFAEARALQKAKQTALEEAGTYVQSYTKVQNLDLTTEEIQTVAGGVLQVEVLEKTRSLVADGLHFYTKIKTTVTTDKMEELVRHIKGKNVAEQYTQLQAEYARLSRELEDWKQRVAKTPQGRERDAALDHIREGAKAFTLVQQREGEFFEHLVSGKQLVESPSRDKEVIDELVNMIVTNGYVVMVGAVQSVLVPRDSSRLSLKVPITIRVAETLHGAMSRAVEVLGGSLRPARVMLEYAAPSSSKLLRGDDTSDRARTTVTLARLGRNVETTLYFQERVGRLEFYVTFLGGTRELDRCSIRPWEALGSDIGSEWARLSPLGPILPVSKVDVTQMPANIFKGGSVEVPDVYAYQPSHRGLGPDVAIIQDEVSFVVRHQLPADDVRSLTSVRVQVRLLTDKDTQSVRFCAVDGGRHYLLPG